MGKKLMLAVAMLALVAAPAFASVQNVKVSGALTTTSIIRNNFSSTAVGSVAKTNEILGQTSLDVSADLTDNVSTKVGLLNERLWGATPATTGPITNYSDNTVKLETAYVQLKELLYSPLTLTVGRQPLVYGNQLIIGSNGNVVNAGQPWADVTQEGNFDAIKAVLSYDPLTVDLFASRIDNNKTASVTTTQDNVNLFGVNANYKFGDKMSTVVEAYTFAKIDDKSTVASNPGDSIKTQTTYVPGLRVSTNPIEGLNVQLEGAYQAGKVWNTTSLVAQTRSAYALQGGVNYALPVLKSIKPVVAGQYTYLSGTTNNNTNNPGKLGRAWDPLYFNQNVGRIFHAAGYDNGNSQLVVVSGEIVPLQDLTTKLSWNGLWLAEKNRDTGAGVNGSKYLGSEIDLDLTYAYTEDVKFGVSAGSFLTGKGIAPNAGTGSANNQNATQLLTSVAVAF